MVTTASLGFFRHFDTGAFKFEYRLYKETTSHKQQAPGPSTSPLSFSENFISQVTNLQPVKFRPCTRYTVSWLCMHNKEFEFLDFLLVKLEISIGLNVCLPSLVFELSLEFRSQQKCIKTICIASF